MNTLKYILLSHLLFLSFSDGFGQGWEQTYGGSMKDSASSVVQTTDGGYIVAGTSLLVPWSVTSKKIYIVKTDAQGDTLWTQFYGHIIGDITVVGIEQTTDGGYVIGGWANFNGYLFLIKTDAQGDTLWTKDYTPNNANAAASAIHQTTDGGYIIAGNRRVYNNGFFYTPYLIKTDAQGDTLWTKLYTNLISEKCYDLQQTIDGGYIFTSTIGSDIKLTKTNSLGDTTWTNIVVQGAPSSIGTAVKQTMTGGYIISGHQTAAPYDAFLIKTNSSGSAIWTRAFAGQSWEDGLHDVIQTTDGGFVATGQLGLSLFLVKTDSNGLVQLTATHGTTATGRSYGTGLQQTTDGGYIVCGIYDLIGNPGINLTLGDYYLLKLQPNGQFYDYSISGNIFQDNNSDCNNNTGDINLGSVLLKAEKPSGLTFWGSTDPQGNYSMFIDSGIYDLEVMTHQTYNASSCQSNPSSFTLDSVQPHQTIDFPLDPIVQCPLLQVDLSTSLLRVVGLSGPYSVNYCNYGTIDASNAYVEITLDSLLSFYNASIPVATQTGNVYTFNLGTVPMNQCGSFEIYVNVNNGAILGQTLCSEAHIYPDSICLPNYWNGAILDAVAQCQNDSIFFNINNMGAAMVGPVQYYVYEDNVMFRNGFTNVIGLGGSQTIIEPAVQGKTYRITVQQETGFPPLLGDTTTTAAIEGCNPFANGSFNTGFITQFSNGNSSPFIAVDCEEVIASYDPNDKSAQPIGYDTQHFISKNTSLDYKIRFQNTGTDTAFLVVIRDTISPYLDLSTLEMGASSHAYTWRVYGQGILEISYNNIMLPDSNVNEPASNGFVRYRISQQVGNPIGTVIYNSAAIYFDYNAPIITNQTFHTIGDDFVTVIILSQSTILDANIAVKIFPNPFTHSTTIAIEGKEYEELNLSLYDLAGRELRQEKSVSKNQIQLSKGNLQPGVYIYKLIGDGALINTGKVIVH